MSESKLYEIREVDDLLNVPADRVVVLLEELKVILPALCGMRANGISKQLVSLPVLRWTDDGKRDLTVTVTATAKPNT